MTAPRPLGSLLVELQGQVLAFPPGALRSVLALSQVARLPRAARGILGVVHLGGRFVTLVDLGLALGLKSDTAGAPNGEGARCVWLAEPYNWAFRADRVLGFEDVTVSTAAPSGWGQPADWAGRAVWQVDVAMAARCLEALLEVA